MSFKTLVTKYIFFKKHQWKMMDTLLEIAHPNIDWNGYYCWRNCPSMYQGKSIHQCVCIDDFKFASDSESD